MRELKYTEDTFISLPEDFADHYQIPKGITKIADSAFESCKYIKSIEIPEGVTSIGNNAFGRCLSLKEINIPEGVTSIGDGAFAVCSSLKEINIPEGVTSIGDIAFIGCLSLKEIKIPEGVTSIGKKTFFRCSSLKEINIPEGVTSIGDEVFIFCKNLNSIRIPSTLTETGKEFLELTCFSDDEIASILRHIENNKTKPEAKHFTHETQTSNGMTNECKTKDNEKNKCFFYYKGRKGITSYSIPNEYSTIEDDAFNECSTLLQIEIPSSVTSIGDNAFNGCSTLTQIEIPSSVTSIGDYAFNGCSSLTQIEIPSSVIRMGSNAFEGCCTLKKIAILGNNTSIDWPLFEDCISLEKVIIKSPRYILENGLVYNKAKTELLECISTLCDKNIVIDPKVRIINSWAFHNLENIESISLPKNLIVIKKCAFDFLDSKVNLIIQTEKIEQIGFDVIYGSFMNLDKGDCSLTVPIGTGYAYRHHPVWKEFKAINVAPFDYDEESESEQEVDV